MLTLIKVLVSIVLVLAVVYTAALAFGAWHWDRATGRLVTRLMAARQPAQPRVVDLRTIEGLPQPVQRYFRAVLRDGQPMIATARVAHEGTFNMSATGEQWKPLTPGQWIKTKRPGFVWNGRLGQPSICQRTLYGHTVCSYR